MTSFYCIQGHYYHQECAFLLMGKEQKSSPYDDRFFSSHNQSWPQAPYSFSFLILLAILRARYILKKSSDFTITSFPQFRKKYSHCHVQAVLYCSESIHIYSPSQLSRGSTDQPFPSPSTIIHSFQSENEYRSN